MTHYVKILHSSLEHHRFTYKEGENVDTVPFDPSGSCQPGGLYFTDLLHFTKFDYIGKLVADVTLPKDARVYAEGEEGQRLFPSRSVYKWKADKIILSNIRPLTEIFAGMSDEKIWDILKQNKRAINYVPFTVMIMAIKQNCEIFKRIYRKYRTLEVCMEAIKHDGLLLRYVEEEIKITSPELCEIAVNQNPLALQYVPLPLRSLELCTNAITQNGNAIKYVPTEIQSPELYTKVVAQDGTLKNLCELLNCVLTQQ